MEEKRNEDRITLESPELLSAVLRLATETEKAKLCELSVLNYSSRGLGLLIAEKDFHLLQVLKPGDKIPVITLFSASTLTTLNGVVKHRTKIRTGTYKGSYILGLEMNAAVEECSEVSSFFSRKF